MAISPISFKKYTPMQAKTDDKKAETKSVSTAKAAACALAGAAAITLGVLAAKGKLKPKSKSKAPEELKPKETVKTPSAEMNTEKTTRQNKLADTIKELFGKECKVSELSKEEKEKLAKTLIEREPDSDMKKELRRIFDEELWDII